MNFKIGKYEMGFRMRNVYRGPRWFWAGPGKSYKNSFSIPLWLELSLQLFKREESVFL